MIRSSFIGDLGVDSGSLSYRGGKGSGLRRFGEIGGDLSEGIGKLWGVFAISLAMIQLSKKPELEMLKTAPGDANSATAARTISTSRKRILEACTYHNLA